MAFLESHTRTFSKTIFYRIVLIITDSIIVYAFTRRLDLTIGSIGVLSVANTFLYYFYERAWNNIHWGKRHLKKKTRKRKG